MENVLSKIFDAVCCVCSYIADNIELGAPDVRRHKWHDVAGCDDSPVDGTYDLSSSYYSSNHDD